MVCAGIIASGLFAATARADTVFSDTGSTPTGLFTTTGNTIGQQVILDYSGGAIITNFSFEIFATNIVSSGATCTIQVCNNTNNGAPDLSSILFTDTFSITNFPAGVLAVEDTGVLFPVNKSFTWFVSFSSLGGGDAGLVFTTNNPSVGSVYNDLWSYDGANWTLRYVPSYTNDFHLLADFQGTGVGPVPEPSILALTGMGASLVSVLYRRRKQETSKD